MRIVFLFCSVPILLLFEFIFELIKYGSLHGEKRPAEVVLVAPSIIVAVRQNIFGRPLLHRVNFPKIGGAYRHFIFFLVTICACNNCLSLIYIVIKAGFFLRVYVKFDVFP